MKNKKYATSDIYPFWINLLLIPFVFILIIYEIDEMFDKYIEYSSKGRIIEIKGRDVEVIGLGFFILALYLAYTLIQFNFRRK